MSEYQKSVEHCCVVDAVLTIEPNWMTFFPGESVTFICDMKEGEDTDWKYRITKDGQDIGYISDPRYTLNHLQTSQSGKYQCHGRQRSSHVTKDSNTVSLAVSGKFSVFYQHD